MKKLCLTLWSFLFLIGTIVTLPVRAVDAVDPYALAYRYYELDRTSTKPLVTDEEVSITVLFKLTGLTNDDELTVKNPSVEMSASSDLIPRSTYRDGTVEVEHAETGTSRTIYVTFTRLRYRGSGSMFELFGDFTLEIKRDGVVDPITKTFSIDETLRIVEAEKTSAAPESKLEPYLTKYEVTAPSIKKNDVFSIVLEVVDPNYKYSDLVNKKFDSSFALLSDKNFNASNMQGTIEDVGSDSMGNLKYLVRFNNIRFVGPAQAMEFRVTYAFDVVIDGKIYRALMDKVLTRNIFETSDEVASGGAVYTPNILISNYTGTGGVVAGKQINFKVTFKNTSSTVPVNNIIIGVNGGEVFSMAKGVNKIFVNEIKPGSEVSIDLSMIANKTAAPSSYPIGFTVSYNYLGEKGEVNANSLESSIAIPVTQVDRVRINYAKVSNAYVDSETELSYSILNTGLSSVKNAQIEVFDENQESLAILFLGAIDPGKEAKGTNMYLTFHEGRDYALTMKLTYEDENFNQKAITEDFSVFVMGGGIVYPPIEPGLPIDEEPVKKNNNLWFFGGALGAVVLVGGFVFYKRRKNKQGVIDDEDL